MQNRTHHRGSIERKSSSKPYYPNPPTDPIYMHHAMEFSKAWLQPLATMLTQWCLCGQSTTLLGLSPGRSATHRSLRSRRSSPWGGIGSSFPVASEVRVHCNDVLRDDEGRRMRGRSARRYR